MVTRFQLAGIVAIVIFSTQLAASKMAGVTGGVSNAFPNASTRHQERAETQNEGGQEYTPPDRGGPENTQGSGAR
jgi:hypothetical protein